MLDAPMLEAAEARVREHDIHPKVFQAVLGWMYSDIVPPETMGNIGQDVLVAADKYQCASLKKWCERELAQRLHVQNAAARFLLSEQVGLAHLKRGCVTFIASNAKAVMNTSEWADIVTYNGGSLVLEVLTRMAEESDKFYLKKADNFRTPDPAKKRRFGQ
tara:strand:+ start:1150 stop:1632 length:483 start_codon:yes stop_codon:yes gene_type:complete